jgi:hypothetical protein
LVVPVDAEAFSIERLQAGAGILYDAFHTMDVVRSLIEPCIEGIRADEKRIRHLMERALTKSATTMPRRSPNQPMLTYDFVT